MEISSNPIFINIIITIVIAVSWIGTCWMAYFHGYRRGYTECKNNVRIKKRTRHKSIRDGDIRILDPTDSHTRYAEAESVRIVGTRVPNYEEENIWL